MVVEIGVVPFSIVDLMLRVETLSNDGFVVKEPGEIEPAKALLRELPIIQASTAEAVRFRAAVVLHAIHDIRKQLKRQAFAH